MKPSIPRGTRDFGPAEMQKRNYIFSVIRKNFELFGYQPIETPAMENLSTLLGKYGDEGDKLVFKVLNSSAAINGTEEELNNLFLEYQKNYNTSTNNLSFTGERAKAIERVKIFLTEKGLRYDLTVPFARYVVMNQGKLTFPLKRYQIQPVWRADKPQKGRYREFYQCDADIIGSRSLLNELELISLMDKVFRELNLPINLKINNRKILAGIAEAIGQKEKLIDFSVVIDKLDKVSFEDVITELRTNDFPEEAITKFRIFFEGMKMKSDSFTEKISKLKLLLSESKIGLEGINEIEFLFNNKVVGMSTDLGLEFDFTLARGLNYYTGTIFEVKANQGTFKPSILGGGRYDDLTGVFGLKDMSGVGISFGVDRIYDVLEELNKFPEDISKTASAKVMFLNFGILEEKECLNLAFKLRAKNISCEIYPDNSKKIDKQFDYADKKNIPFVCYVKSENISTGIYDLKDTRIREVYKLSIEDIIKKLK